METLTTTANIEQISFREFTIEKNYDRYTVRITYPSKRARLGYKTDAYYSFRRTDISASIMQMNLFVDKFMTQKNAEAEAKEVKKAKLTDARKNFTSPFEVGQILYNSYGYEQTNVSFYQITKIEGKTVTVRQVCQDRTDTGNMSGKTMPIKDEFCGQEIKKIVQIRMWGETLKVYIDGMSEWDGQAKYWSSYY